MSIFLRVSTLSRRKSDGIAAGLNPSDAAGRNRGGILVEPALSGGEVLDNRKKSDIILLYSELRDPVSGSAADIPQPDEPTYSKKDKGSIIL